MAGKSNRGRNRKGSNTTTNSSSESAVTASAPVKDNLIASETAKADANGVPAVIESTNAIPPGGSESETTTSANEPKQGELHLYPVSVKTQSSEKLELQLNPGDSVMDIRQFLLDAPETCFFTCYDLVLRTKDGSTHQLEDYNEISEVADITTGGCSLEMVAAPYDDRSVRAHVHRTRELLSLSTLHSSLSTSLALEYETAQTKGPETVKTEVPELDGLGFMDDVAGSLGKLLSSPSKEIKCVESIVFSSFNPPPSYRRLVGDLIYLDVVTLEGTKYCITGTTKTFYVNSSTGNALDPKPSKSTSEATTLIGLLQKISSKFKKAFREILERKASAHPFENVQSLLPPNSWLGLHPIPDHRRDAARAEDALTLSYGSELIGMQRDWNEELQSCREFPHTTPQERILRDRALYKVTSDFVDAAISGAIGVISRCIPPINPTDPECFHMYVHNNIFFSFAVDADLEQLSKKHTADTNSKTLNVAVSPNTSEKVSNDFSHGDGGISNGDCDVSTAGESNGVMESTPSESQLAESEQATYASANNDLKGTKAYQEADVPGLYNLAMAIIDYRGHRVVAQSVLPGILQGDKSDSLLYGSVDNGKKICWNEDFHSKVLEAAKRLHLKEHTVVDGSGNAFKLAAPVECKGIVGSDDRHYLLDLMRVTPRDANYSGLGSRFCILRPELIAAFCQAEAAKNSKTLPKSEGEAHATPDSSEVAGIEEQAKPEANFPVASTETQEIVQEGKVETVEECASAPSVGSESYDEILFNPNVFTEFKLAGNPEEIENDEENVRKASSYLAATVLPKFIQDLCTLEVSPMDGQTLTEALHAHGINVRYIGRVAEGTKHLPHLWDLCSNEIVVRSAKHIFKDVLRDTEDQDLGPVISHFFNCFFGNCQAVGAKGGSNGSQPRTQKKDQSGHHSSGKSSRGQTRWKGASARKNQSSSMNVSSETVWSEIQEFAKLKYQFELLEDARARVKKVSVIRNLCQKVGVTVAARKYDLNAAAPFQMTDILDLQPVVKHSVPVCSEAKDLVETGKIQLAEGMLSEAYTLFSEAFSILQQVTGPMHREVANCCRYLAMVLYHAGDMAGAIIQQHKELIINERCLGLDHPDTAHSYGNMALFYHGLNQTELALRHMSRALLLLSLSSGPDHPDVAATFINVAMMYQDIGKMNTALRYLQEALKKNERLLGEEHIQTAVCYHALAIAFNCMGAFKLSHQHEKKTYHILVKQLGEEDSRTRDSQNWMKTFKMRELQMNAQKQKGQALNAASAQKAIDILKAHPDLIQAFQAAAATGGSGSSSASINKSLNAAIIGETLPRGRGVDERAARAAAEVRKKAAARGLLIRPHGVPVQALPPLTQLLNIINSGMTPDAVDNEEPNGAKKEANGQPTDGPADSNKDQIPAQEDPAPVGLGKGLTSLDNKKQKTKPKSVA
ncbi:clustered mitochondria protein [Ricinus communis]|uniref:Clustered mitochondria protein homolog n=1 Tax=Ricinus communis TaxID=3988 RepID=B9RHH9_RICCO|nr:clustered mitochondria protein [Ricinus communis]XP_048232216.1 clustered mitochondria protein [Ricinus communis]EEF49189.1 eukaryotic translation initiation factor 3 subunit, putative [Ricinus communis]|eukprot:XP_025012064.1 clustered mitochondria protein [Ricinus communis]